jgi:predicted TIM-barrel fold metal-dependent hydrolase
MYGSHAESVAPDDFVPWARYGFTGKTLDDYLELMRETIRARHRAGKVVALKCAEAYQRPIQFMPDDRAAAQQIFGAHPSSVTREQHLLFGNYIFNRCCELAAELDLPFQIHTGLGNLSGSQPMHLIPVIERHPKTRFVLFHAGYPWTHEVAGLAHNYPNAYPSLTWTATICTAAAVRALHDFIDVAPSINTITWGSDCRIAEESVGALLAWRHIVATVIAERLEDGRLRPLDAHVLARKLLFENGWRVYLNG